MTKFLEGCKSSKEARKRAPWAGIIKKICGGYMAFEFFGDYETWKNQK